MLGGMCALQGLSAVVMNARPTTPHQPSQEIGGTPRRYARQVVVIATPAPPGPSPRPLILTKITTPPFSIRFFCLQCQTCSCSDAAPLDTLQVQGSCDGQSFLNTNFVKQGVTADNRAYYQSKDGLYYLYYDKDCDGSGGVAASWIFDGSKPSISATSDLDEDGGCVFNGYIGSNSLIPPESADWNLNCLDGSFVDVPLTIEPVEYAGWHVCPPGSFCSGDGCPSNNATAAIPRDRWDPNKVREIPLFVKGVHLRTQHC